MTDASTGNGTIFELGAGNKVPGPETFTEIAEVFDVTPPNEVTATVDASHMGSPDRQFIMGLNDPGEASFQMNFLPASASEDAILAAKALRKKVGARITYPNGAVWEFDMLVTGYEPAVPNEDRMTATVTGKVTGSVVREDPA